MVDSTPVQKGLRMYQIFRWINALDEGFGTRRDERSAEIDQPPTLPNLCAHMLLKPRKPVLKERLKRKQGRYYHNRDNWFTYLKSLVGQLVRQYRGKGLIVYGDTKIRKTRYNHLDLEEGLAEQRQRVRILDLTSYGETKMSRISTQFQEKQELGEQASRKIESDTVLVPKERYSGWKIMKFTVPRIENGCLMENGESISKYL